MHPAAAEALVLSPTSPPLRSGWKRPARHAVHSRLFSSVDDCPAGQALQTLSVVSQPDVMRLPGAQIVHGWHAAFSFSLNMPAKHLNGSQTRPQSVQLRCAAKMLDRLDDVPASQLVQCVTPDTLLRVLAEHRLQTLAPKASACVPAAHFLHFRWAGASL